MSNSNIAESIGLIRAQVLKQGLAKQDQLKASALLDGYQAQLQSLGATATTVSGGTASSMPQAVNALNSQLAAVTGLSGYTQGAVRDLTAQLFAELGAHNVVMTS